MKITIYTMTHKKFPVPPDPMYRPLQVGSAAHEDFGYLRDDAGENISGLNCYYSELTGFYWIWKNDRTSDYVGTCHYRRYLINEQEKILTRREYQELLSRYDLITTKKERLNNSYYYGFSANHNRAVLDETGEVIRELYPEYYDTFISLVNGPETYYCNMLVTSKALFDEYARWLFSVFFEVQKRVDLDTEQDDYHKRVFGFISEFLLTVWVTVRNLKVYECKVGILGEKAETGEIKEKLAAFIREKDVEGAKAYFLEQHKKRPDVMMEAADITGELHLAMQIIATADAEVQKKGSCLLEQEAELNKLIPVFAGLNRTVSDYAQRLENPKSDRIFENPLVSGEAIRIAVLILPNARVDKRQLSERLLEKYRKADGVRRAQQQNS